VRQISEDVTIVLYRRGTGGVAQKIMGNFTISNMTV